MAKLMVLAAIVLLPYGINAQDFLEKLRNDYKGCSECTFFHLEGNFMSSLFEDDNGDDTSALLKQVKGIELISIPKAKVDFKNDDVNMLKRSIDKARFENLVSFKEKGSSINLMVHEKNGRIDQALLLVDDLDDFLVVSFNGDLDRKTAEKISKQFKFN